MRYLLLISVLALQACSVNPVSGKKEISLMSEQQEIATGKQYHSQILKQYGLYQDNALQAYVNAIGQDMAKKSHRSQLPFTFTVLDSPVINAFALPGGYVYVTRGIMGYMNSEAELAGVIGHEIGHVTARHGARKQTNSTLAGLGSMVIGVATGSKELMDISQMLGGALVSGYGREYELESDRLGAEYLAKSGYRPQAMIDTISVLKDQEVFNNDLARTEGRKPQNYHGLFASHPRNDKRLQEVVKLADRYKGSLTKDDGVDRFLKATENMMFGDSPSQGLIRDQQFLHPDLGFAFSIPPKWKLNNLPDSIILISPIQDSQIQITLEKLKGKISSKEFLTNTINKSPNLAPNTIHPFGISNMQAHTVATQIKTKQGNLPARITAVIKDDVAYTIAGIAKNGQAFRNNDQNFIRFVKSFHRITNKELAKAQPYRFKLIRAKRGMTYEQLAVGSPIKKYAANRLRLLNGDYPNKQPTPGRLIKVIE